MYDCKKLKERFLHDAEFCSLVRLMENLVLEHGFGMVEFREAAFFATWKVAVENAEHLVLTDNGLEPFTRDTCKTHVPISYKNKK